MAFQQQQPTQQYGQQTTGQQTTGQQMGGQQPTMGGQQYTVQHGGPQQLVQQTGERFRDDLTSEMRLALDDLHEVESITQWCIDKMVDMGPHMNECIRVCDDIGDMAHIAEKLLARNSTYGLEAALTFLGVARDGLPVIQSHDNPHCSETADVINRAMDSNREMIYQFVPRELVQDFKRSHLQFRQIARQSQANVIPSSVWQRQQQSGQPMGSQMGEQYGGTQQPTGQQMGTQQYGSQQPTGQQMGTQQYGSQQPTGQQYGGGQEQWGQPQTGGQQY
ncbi:hypothetical protein ACFQH6_07060 [Halobacteriaceae archaeon GCM10025711]